MPEEDSLYFRLDHRDRIVDAGGAAWDSFARANGGDGALSAGILGSTLFTHVSGETTVMFLRVLLESVRTFHQPATRPYRCDSPDLKRFMEMTVSPGDGRGALNIAHRHIRSEPFAARIAFTTSPASGPRLVLRCSMCNRLRVSGVWIEPDEIIRRGFGVSSGPNPVVYSVCPRCKAGARLRPDIRQPFYS